MSHLMEMYKMEFSKEEENFELAKPLLVMELVQEQFPAVQEIIEDAILCEPIFRSF